MSEATDQTTGQSQTTEGSGPTGGPIPPNVQSATAQSAPNQSDAEAKGHAPVPPAGATDASGARPAAAAGDAAAPQAPTEKKHWPKTQRGLIILVVVLALLLGFAGGVAGSFVVSATGLFQQQEAGAAFDDVQGGMSGDMTGEAPDGMGGDMDEMPDGTDWDDSSDTQQG